MKAIKLILLFLLIGGGIFVALNWGSLFSDNDDNSLSNESTKKINVGDKCSEIDKVWDGEDLWNDGLYNSQKTDIEQSHQLNLYTPDGYLTVKNRLKEVASNKAYYSYLQIIHDSIPFDEPLLNEQYNGLMKVKNDFGMSDDHRIQEIDGTHQLYKRAQAFVNSSKDITPAFNKSSKTWVSFKTLQDKILNEATSIRDNQYYTHIKNVPSFVGEFDNDYLLSITNNQKRDFYEKLSREIYDYLSELNVSQATLNLLINLRTKLDNEEESMGFGRTDRPGMEKLAELKGDIEDQLYYY